MVVRYLVAIMHKTGMVYGPLGNRVRSYGVLVHRRHACLFREVESSWHSRRVGYFEQW